jgi:RNA binding exosome subunit
MSSDARRARPWGGSMAKLPIHWIEVRTYSHATEDEARVSAALAFALPQGESIREVLEGHFRNTLVRLTRRVEDAKSIRATWERWSTSGLPQWFESDVDARVDNDGVLHFRLDKQAAFLERWALAKDSDAIDVRLKLVAYPAKPEIARRVARSILEGAV